MSAPRDPAAAAYGLSLKYLLALQRLAREVGAPVIPLPEWPEADDPQGRDS